MSIDRAGVGGPRDGHLEREQLGGRGIERRPGSRKSDANARPRFAGLLDHGSEVLKPHGGVSAPPRRRYWGYHLAEALTRYPNRMNCRPVAEPLCTTITASRSTRLVPADSSASCRLANSVASALASNCWRRSVSALVFAPRFSMTNLLRVRTASLSSRPFSVRPVAAGAGETPEFLKISEVLLLDGDLFLESARVGLQFLEQLLFAPDLLPCVVLDRAGAESGTEHAEAVGPLGVE